MLGLPELFNGLAAIRVNVSGLYHEKILFKLWVLKSRIQKKNRRPRSPESPDLLFFPCLALGLRCGGGGATSAVDGCLVWKMVMEWRIVWVPPSPPTHPHRELYSILNKSSLQTSLPCHPWRCRHSFFDFFLVLFSTVFIHFYYHCLYLGFRFVPGCIAANWDSCFGSLLFICSFTVV